MYSINNTFCEVVGVVDLDLYKVNIFNSKSLYRYNYFESSSIGCYEADDFDFNVYIVNKNEIKKNGIGIINIAPYDNKIVFLSQHH